MKKILTIVTFFLLPFLAFASTNAKFTEGKQYKKVVPSTSVPTRFTIPKNKVLVVEFFNYGCPWCFHLEKSLEAWLKTKPSYVVFKRVPLNFERGWDTYSKAYYAAEALGILDKITPALFKAIHVQNEDLTSEDAMQKFFAAHGVSKNKFESIFNFSPGIGMEIQHAQKLMLAYQVFAIPTIIVDGKYYTSAELSNGNDKEMMATVNYLIEKVRNSHAK